MKNHNHPTTTVLTQRECDDRDKIERQRNIFDRKKPKAISVVFIRSSITVSWRDANQPYCNSDAFERGKNV